MELKLIPHKEVSDYLRGNEVVNLFPLYVCQQKPDATSPIVVHDSRIVGTVINGKEFGIQPISTFWLVANTRDTASLLLNHTRHQHGTEININFPLQYYDLVHQTFPTRTITIDHLYVLIPSKFQKHKSPYPITLLTPTLLKQVMIPEELNSLIGDPHDLEEVMPFYGMIQKNQIVAIAETSVDIGTCAAIQQVYTLKRYRGHGFGKSIISTVSEILIEQNKLPIYWVAEQNISSIRLVQKLGFELLIRLGCMES
ncbi:MAG: GNAT family N-acetyltransferase [candidate division Zixibacteria bacterium]|nr:GNAT family N-acetyltransferase [candidate division Zixibacteria bacterium]